MVSPLAVLAGLFAAGGIGTYGVKKFLIDPYNEYRQIRKNVSRDLVNYANRIANPGSGDPDRIDEAETELRNRASELQAAVDDLLLYDFWRG